MTGTPPEPDLLTEGRSLVRVNLWRIFWVSAFVAWLGGRTAEAGSTALLRVIVIALLCLLVYRGYRWALWALGVFTVIAGVIMVGIAVVSSALQPIDRALLGVAGGVQVAAFVILLRAPVIVVPLGDLLHRPVPQTVPDQYLLYWSDEPGRELVMGGGLLMFYNHADDPNIEFRDGPDPETMSVFTVRAVRAGEELAYDYGVPLWFTPAPDEP